MKELYQNLYTDQIVEVRCRIFYNIGYQDITRPNYNTWYMHYKTFNKHFKKIEGDV